MNTPNKCPSCGGKIVVTELSCSACKTMVKGKFSLNDFSFLEESELEFVKIFLATHGNIKEVEKSLGISYPTVKNRLEAVVEKLGLAEYDPDFRKKKMEILERLDKGEITPKDAVKLIKGLRK